MRIGIDFDNTIACYDGVFHRAAVERRLVSADTGTDKNSVRDYLNNSGQKDAITELQGYIYGSRMDLATPYDGVADFVSTARAAGHELFIMSHKTRHPMLGPKHDMHEAARGFLRDNGLMGEAADQILPANVYFELTKDDKIDRVAANGVNVFIDDLPEILTMDKMPEQVRCVLFDPADTHKPTNDFESVQSWHDFSKLILEAK